jgi:hypothetical protein
MHVCVFLATLERLNLNIVNLADAGVTVLSLYFAIIKAVQANKTLKSLWLCNFPPPMSDELVKNLTLLIKQNYGLESLPNIHSGERMGDMRAILRLNKVGRRYLHDDGSSIVKGVDVLSAVSDDLNCVFLHLLENPSLCNRDAN